MSKKLIIVCLVNFFVAALMGLALRYTFIESIPINYRYLTHAHSHVAMLGWVYLILFVLLTHYFVPEKKSIYNRLFWLTEFSVLGMMISFPIQGYGAISIAFSTLHIFCSYFFVFFIWKDQKSNSLVISKLLKTSLIFMLISTIGVWCLGPAISMVGQASAFYQIAIQFFLHFQFNGWFLIAVIAVFLHILNINYSKSFRLFFNFLIGSTILTLALPVQWFAPHKSLIWINGIGVVLQLFTIFFFLKIIKPKLLEVIKTQSKLIVYLFSFSIFCLIIKVLLQLTAFIPEFSEIVNTHRNLVIGFIHLLMLGVISGFLISFILKKNIVTFNSTLYIGVFCFILGFVLTEILLLIQGYMYFSGDGILTNYFTLLFLFSVFLPLGILMILINIIKHKNHETQTSVTS